MLLLHLIVWRIGQQASNGQHVHIYEWNTISTNFQHRNSEREIKFIQFGYTNHIKSIKVQRWLDCEPRCSKWSKTQCQSTFPRCDYKSVCARGTFQMLNLNAECAKIDAMNGTKVSWWTFDKLNRESMNSTLWKAKIENTRETRGPTYENISFHGSGAHTANGGGFPPTKMGPSCFSGRPKTQFENWP